MRSNYHESVMVSEVVSELHIKKAHKYIDATLGTGGHTLEIIKKGGEVLGIEADPEMLAIARKRLAKDAKLVLGNFVNIDQIAAEFGFSEVDGILFDLGVSNLQLTNLERGFSFGSPEANLDMRINPEDQGVTGADLLNVLRSDQLEEMFEVTVIPGGARWLTKKVIEKREAGQIQTVGDFVEICRGFKSGKAKLHEATLPFLALRIAVNSELDNLKEALPKAWGLLAGGGKLVVITFHSGEDAIVKGFMKREDLVITPGQSEISENPRARSAKMRVFTK